MLKVLVVDDHAIVRVGLRDIIRSAFENVSVGEARDGYDALVLARQQSWDVVVLDINMPGMSGLETLEHLRRDRPEVPVIMMSMHSGGAYLERSFKLGAAAYVCKEDAPDELVQAMEAVLAGGIYVSQALRPHRAHVDRSLAAGGRRRPEHARPRR